MTGGCVFRFGQSYETDPSNSVKKQNALPKMFRSLQQTEVGNRIPFARIPSYSSTDFLTVISHLCYRCKV